MSLRLKCLEIPAEKIHAIRRDSPVALTNPEMASANPDAAAGGAGSPGAQNGGKLNKLVDKWQAEEGKSRTGRKQHAGQGVVDQLAPPAREQVISSRASAAAKAREAYRDRHYLAATKILHKQLQQDPYDQQASAFMAKGLRELNAARPYFVAHGKERTRPVVRATPGPEPEPEPEAPVPVAVPDEVDDEWRKNADYKEFQGYWSEIEPELNTLMKKEPEANWSTLKDTCWTLYPNIKAMFIFYAAKDAALEARRQKAAKSQKNPTKKVDLWTEKRGANAGVSMSKTMSALEFSEFMQDTALVSKKGSPTSLSKADAQLVFTRVNWERDDDGGMGQDDDNPDFELMGHEFLHAVIRIAHGIPVLQEMPLYERVLHCVQKMMFPKAQKIEMTDFPERFESPHVVNALKENEFLLKTLFTHFSVTTGEDDGEDLGSMDLDELVHMCKELSIINEMCPEEVVLTSHIMAQEDTHSKSSELGYDAFLVAFCRIADLWTQNKYTKLSVKVKLLLEHADKEMMLLTSSSPDNREDAIDEALQAKDEAMLQVNSIRIRDDDGDTEEETTPEEAGQQDEAQTETETIGE